ncbi:MAG: SGNH/GDSL hydrolase family protein [Gammaproteobacteria bacterium]|nr:SGNH/GDSL hydrolase family protein [Gammaproteobacteria bacterium]
MEQILVYGDSLSWGIVPGSRARHPFPVRWPGRLERRLVERGREVRVIEDCLNGRRTVWEDPFKPGRRGVDGLGQRIEAHSPLALVILALGTNDFQSMHPHVAWHAAQGVAALVAAIRTAPVEPGMPSPPVLVVVPPPIGEPRGAIAPKFAGGAPKCAGLAEAYREVTTELGCALFDAGDVVTASAVDGVHLDAEAHRALGDALAGPVAKLLGEH